MKYTLIFAMLTVLFSCSKESEPIEEEIKEDVIGKVITYQEQEGSPNEDWRMHTTPVENQLVNFYHVTRDYSGYPGELGYGKINGCSLKSRTRTNADGEYTVPLSKLDYATVHADIDPNALSFSNANCRQHPGDYEIIVAYIKILELDFKLAGSPNDNGLVGSYLSHNIEDSFISPNKSAQPIGSKRGYYVLPNINYKLTYYLASNPEIVDMLYFYTGDLEEELSFTIEL